MTLVFVLFGIGIALMVVEVVIPGGLLGVLAGMALAGGVVAAFVEFGSIGGSVATGLALLIAAVTLYFEFVLLPKTRLARKFSMAETGSGRSQPEVAERDAVLNREALAVTTLAPSGYVELAGRRYEAFCRTGHAVAGSRMRIVDIDNFRLVVTQIKESS
jgi:membrane-bound serine protease (ClpP class)